jgi:hypothetical protein
MGLLAKWMQIIDASMTAAAPALEGAGAGVAEGVGFGLEDGICVGFEDGACVGLEDAACVGLADGAGFWLDDGVGLASGTTAAGGEPPPPPLHPTTVRAPSVRKNSICKKRLTAYCTPNAIAFGVVVG